MLYISYFSCKHYPIFILNPVDFLAKRGRIKIIYPSNVDCQKEAVLKWVIF